MRELLAAREQDPAAHAEIVRYYATYVPAYLDGHLLVAGGVADQPARYLEMIQTIAGLAAKAELKYLELTEEK